jgi:hypothetical protein
MNDKPLITLPEPRRSWLVHCTDAFGVLGVCALTVEQGRIAIYAPGGSEGFDLDRVNIAEFRAAFNAAVDVAESDLRAETLTHPQP